MSGNTPKIFAAIDLFDANQEMNVPTFYSAFILVLSSLLLIRISVHKNRQDESYIHWLILGLIFLFLTIDELYSVHNRLGGSLAQILGTSGYLHNDWVIPYTIATIFILTMYSRFLLALPKRTAILFVVAGLIYLAGAVGFEVIGGHHIELYQRDLTYHIYATIEEFLEILGISIFIYSLLSYISSGYGSKQDVLVK